MASAGSPPKPPDPTTVINAQTQANRYNNQNPFGSQVWSKGPDGTAQLTTSANPQTQAAIDRAFALSATPSTPIGIPQGMGQLASAVLGKVGQHYGLGNGTGQSPLNTNMAQMKSGSAAPPAPGGGGMGMPGLNGMQGGLPGQQSAFGGMNSAMSGMPQMGLQGGGIGSQQLGSPQMQMPSLGGYTPINPMGSAQTQPMPPPQVV